MRLNSNTRVLILGATGLVGYAFNQFLESQNFSNVYAVGSSEIDLSDYSSTDSLISSFKPELVLLAAGRVGGIAYNTNNALEILTVNTRIQLNVIESSLRLQVPNLVTFGSTSMYPELVSQPMAESSIGSGSIQDNLKPFGISKLLSLEYLRNINKGDFYNYRMVIAANLFGANDNFHFENSHALQGIMSKIELAKLKNDPTVTLWGDGTPLRELLHVNDLVSATLCIIESEKEEFVFNVGSGEELRIADIAYLIKELMDYPGGITWGSAEANSVPRRLLDSSKVRSLGWKTESSLVEALSSYIVAFAEGTLKRRSC